MKCPLLSATLPHHQAREFCNVQGFTPGKNKRSWLKYSPGLPVSVPDLQFTQHPNDSSPLCPTTLRATPLEGHLNPEELPPPPPRYVFTEGKAVSPCELSGFPLCLLHFSECVSSEQAAVISLEGKTCGPICKKLISSDEMS